MRDHAKARNGRHPNSRLAYRLVGDHLSMRDRLLALEENRNTNQKLRQAGFDVQTFPGAELCINGGGGPTCLTRPLLRTT